LTASLPRVSYYTTPAGLLNANLPTEGVVNDISIQKLLKSQRMKVCWGLVVTARSRLGCFNRGDGYHFVEMDKGE